MKSTTTWPCESDQEIKLFQSFLFPNKNVHLFRLLRKRCFLLITNSNLLPALGITFYCLGRAERRAHCSCAGDTTPAKGWSWDQALTAFAILLRILTEPVLPNSVGSRKTLVFKTPSTPVQINGIICLLILNHTEAFPSCRTRGQDQSTNTSKITMKALSTWPELWNHLDLSTLHAYFLFLFSPFSCVTSPVLLHREFCQNTAL